MNWNHNSEIILFKRHRQPRFTIHFLVDFWCFKQSHWKTMAQFLPLMFKSFLNAGISEGRIPLRNSKLISITQLSWVFFFRYQTNWSGIPRLKTFEIYYGFHVNHYNKDLLLGTVLLFFFLLNILGFEQASILFWWVNRQVWLYFPYGLSVARYEEHLFWSCHRSLQPRQDFSHLTHRGESSIMGSSSDWWLLWFLKCQSREEVWSSGLHGTCKNSKL